MIISFNTIQDQNNGFEILVLSNMKFTYIGNHKVRINKHQHDLLKANNVKVRVHERN